MSREDEEAAELEKLQQDITLTLQEIDQNFARCVQIVNSGIIPEFDRYQAASRGVWDGLKVWLHFFERVELTVMPQSTNRPPFGSGIADSPKEQSPWDRLKDKFSPSNQDLGQMLQRPPHKHMLASATTATSTSLLKPHTDALSSYNVGSSSSGSTTPSFRRRTSPPKTIPFALSPSDLVGTPAREAARILVDNQLQIAGAASPPSSGSSKEQGHGDGEDDEMSEGLADQHNEEKGLDGMKGNETPASWVNQHSDSDREKFEGFMRDRKQKYRQMDLDDELPTVRRDPPRSPGRYHSEEDVPSFPMITGTPVANYDQDLRPPSKRARETSQDSLLMSAVRDTNDDDDGAFQFAQITPSRLVLQDGDQQSMVGTPLGSGSSVSSRASRLPKQFSLHYFSSSFQKSPASTQLTRIYTLFSQRPGEPLTLDEIMQLLDDPSFTVERVKLFVDVLTSKKFTKKEGEGRWILRQ
ncbi:DASH complex subunit Ask1-domain-containing protein [Fennellomyces sp. T-0311]|nr:DASH complex subunit Ask1-domain-containing protein [Fennellomyces sp. T-0311]